MKKNNTHEKIIIYKFLLCLVYLVIITILFVCSYKLFKEKNSIISWQNVKNTKDYSYIEVFKMSEAFAYYEKDNKQIHFVIEKEDTGLWHTYLIAIKKSDYSKFKNIIDYTYERVTDVPKSIKVYGYPVVIDKNLKKVAIKNIKNFLPKENEVSINSKNFNKYLTNCYMDTTLSKNNNFDFYLFLTLFLIIVMIFLFIITCFYKDGDIGKIHRKLKRQSDINFKSDQKYKLVRR